MQTLRRLAQNREAARKSRLRKKVGTFMLYWYQLTFFLFLFSYYHALGYSLRIVALIFYMCNMLVTCDISILPWSAIYQYPVQHFIFMSRIRVPTISVVCFCGTTISIAWFCGINAVSFSIMASDWFISNMSILGSSQILLVLIYTLSCYHQKYYHIFFFWNKLKYRKVYCCSVKCAKQCLNDMI